MLSPVATGPSSAQSAGVALAQVGPLPVDPVLHRQQHAADGRGSSKQHERQIDVTHDIAKQIREGSRHVFGVMIESHLQGGAQKFTPGKDDVGQLEFGKSITDACLGWDDSVACLKSLAEAVAARR